MSEVSTARKDIERGKVEVVIWRHIMWSEYMILQDNTHRKSVEEWIYAIDDGEN